ncbi:hypothetical protein [Marinomonas sp. THO17]|uniref:hypothetical protein n=1 Tax=Marinomonas sp. THO17 TaxID=3149048 RepID=UPI00336BF7A8
MNSIILGILSNLGATLLTKTFGIWLAKLAAKATNTMVDDNLVLLLEGGLENDAQKIEQAAKDILKEVSGRFTQD